MEYLEQLIKIYNTLNLVSTKGEDTIVMGQCLNAFKKVLVDMQNITENSNITSE